MSQQVMTCIIQNGVTKGTGSVYDALENITTEIGKEKTKHFIAALKNNASWWKFEYQYP